MISDAEYMAHPKVQQARRLLLEAWQELRREAQAAADKQICRCSHRRNAHGPSHSINYTGGVCGDAACRCLNFEVK
jgi:hypothetical protein